MKITKANYNKIIESCSTTLSETGGIIGGKNNIVTVFEFDKGTASSSRNYYYPNIERLNACIKYWQKEDIQFYGIVHSHLQEDEKELSNGDRQYINQIMLAMPKDIESLYFPLVLPNGEMVSFKALRLGNEMKIIKDVVKIIDGKEE